MINKKKTITIFAVLLTALLIPSGIAAYAESDDTQTQQTSKMQNFKHAFDGIETSMMQNPTITSGMRSPVGSSPASSVNMVMINEDAGELWVGIDRSKYSGSLDSFESHLQNKYPNTPIRVEHADFEWNACPSLTSNTCNPQVAGMEYWYLVSSKSKKDATLGLAVEDNNGKKGVIISAHAIGFGNIGKNIASDILRDSKGNFIYPVHHGKVIKNTAPDSSNVVPCDCAFVEFTKTNGIYNETVEKNKIYKGRNAVYTVTGVHAPAHGDAIKMVGKESGSNSTNIIGTSLSFTASDGIKVKGTFATNSIMKKGDSGAPIFTTPNKNNEVKIVGMHSGTFDFAGTDVDVHMPWSKIATNLGLKAP